MKCNVYLCTASDIDLSLTADLVSAIKRISSDACNVTITSTKCLDNVDIVVLALPKLSWAIYIDRCPKDILDVKTTAKAKNKPVFIVYKRFTDRNICIYESYISSGVISAKTVHAVDNISFCKEVDKTISKLKGQTSQNSKGCETKPVSEKSPYDKRILLLIE